MAFPQEILVGRYNRFAQKLLSMKGPANVRLLNPSIDFVFPLFHGVENRYLEAWDRFGVVLSSAGVAAQQAATRIRNPVGSNVVAVVESCIYLNISAGLQQPVIETGAITTDYPGGVTGATIDPRGRNNSTCVASTSGTGVSLANQFLEAALVTNTSWQFVLNVNQEMPILPGQALQTKVAPVNTQNITAWLWRERFLEDSERA